MIIIHLAVSDIPFEAVFPEMHVRWKRRGKSDQHEQNICLFLTYDQHTSIRQQETLKMLHWRSQVLQKPVTMTHDNQLKHIIPIFHVNSTATAKTAHGKGCDTRVWPGTDRAMGDHYRVMQGWGHETEANSCTIPHWTSQNLGEKVPGHMHFTFCRHCLHYNIHHYNVLSNKKKTIYIEQLKHKRLGIVVQ